MARRRTTTVEEELEQQEQGHGITLDAESEDDELSRVDTLVSEFRGNDDTTLSVFRQGVGKNNLSFLFSSTPDDMTGSAIMEKCRDEHDGGNFRMHIRDRAGLVKNVSFSVEAPKQKKSEERRDGFGVAEILAMSEQSNQRMMSMFQTTMAAFAEAFKGGANQAPPTPAVDPIMVQKSIIDSVTAIVGMTNAAEQKKDPVELLIQGLTLGKELIPKEGETNSSDILLEAMKQFAPTLIASAGPKAGNPQPERAPNGTPRIEHQQSQETADVAKEKEKLMQQQAMKGQLNWLLAQAKAGKNPELYAELLLDQVGEEKVLAFIGNPNALDMLANILPEVRAYESWFSELRDAIIELTTDEGEGDTTGTEPVPEPEQETDAIHDAGSNSDPTSNP